MTDRSDRLSKQIPGAGPLVSELPRDPDGPLKTGGPLSAVPSHGRVVEPTAIHFVGRFLSERWPDIHEMEEKDVTEQAGRFRGGLNNWIHQTYLHLKDPLHALGIGCSISEEFIPGAINIAHRDSLNRFFVPYYRCFIVGVRADRPTVYLCDWEILQNDLEHRSLTQTYLPLWPQPGLLPRDPGRGSKVERIGYFGRTGTAAAWTREPRFHEALAKLGVSYEVRDAKWFDYSDIDLVLAHREEAPTMLLQKPASKLVNAWHAGVPALVREEPAFRSLRHSDLDYLAVGSAEEVLAAVRRLQSDPILYHAMAHNGRVRAVDFTVGQIRELWMECLLEKVLPYARQLPAPNFAAGIWMQSRRLIKQKISSRVFKYRYAREVAGIKEDAS